jgi:hypothetical protein
LRDWLAHNYGGLINYIHPTNHQVIIQIDSSNIVYLSNGLI